MATLSEFDEMKKQNDRILELERQVKELWQERDHQGKVNRDLWKKLAELELKLLEAVKFMCNRMNQTGYINGGESERITPLILERLADEPISLSLELKEELTLKNFMFILKGMGDD